MQQVTSRSLSDTTAAVENICSWRIDVPSLEQLLLASSRSDGVFVPSDRHRYTHIDALRPTPAQSEEYEFMLTPAHDHKNTMSVLVGLMMIVAVNLVTNAVASAAVPQSEANKLNSKLTTMGANPEGNAAGTIPQIGRRAPANRPAEEVLYIVNSNNLAQHRDKLTPGQIALVNTYPGFEIQVYPSTRHRCYPNNIEENTRLNAVNASLTRDAKAPTNVRRGIPFPMPQSGLEAIFNHLMRPQPLAMAVSAEKTTKLQQGSETLSIFSVHLQSVNDGARTNFEMLSLNNPINGEFRRLVHTNFGDMTLHELGKGNRAWVLRAGTRRVRRAGNNFFFDSPTANGLMTADSIELFNGVPHNYEWALDEGTHEILMGYGAEQNSLSASEIAAGAASAKYYPDPSSLYYELHRAYRIEATTREGKRHLYKRRVIFLDEDSWIAVAADLYDSRGELSRTHQGFIGRHADNAGHAWCLLNNDVSYDLLGGTYVVTTRDITPDGANITEDDFTPVTLRNRGARSFFK